MGCAKSTPVIDECNPEDTSQMATKPSKLDDGSHITSHSAQQDITKPAVASVMSPAAGHPCLPRQVPAIAPNLNGMASYGGISAPLPEPQQIYADHCHGPCMKNSMLMNQGDWAMQQEAFSGSSDECASHSANAGLPKGAARQDGIMQQNMSQYSTQTLNFVAGGGDMTGSTTGMSCGPMPFYARSNSHPNHAANSLAHASSNGQVSGDLNAHQTRRVTHTPGRTSRKEKASVSPGLSSIQEAENSPKAAGNGNTCFTFAVVGGQTSRASEDSVGVSTPSSGKSSSAFTGHASAPEATMAAREFNLELPTAHSDPSEMVFAHPKESVTLQRGSQGVSTRASVGKSSLSRQLPPVQQQASMGATSTFTDPGIMGAQPMRQSLLGNQHPAAAAAQADMLTYPNPPSPQLGYRQSSVQMHAQSDAVAYMHSTQMMMTTDGRSKDRMHSGQFYGTNMLDQPLPPRTSVTLMYSNGQQAPYPMPASGFVASPIIVQPQQAFILSPIMAPSYCTTSLSRQSSSGGSTYVQYRTSTTGAVDAPLMLRPSLVGNPVLVPTKDAFMMQAPHFDPFPNQYMTAARQSSTGGSRTSLAGTSDGYSAHSTPLSANAYSPTGPPAPRRMQSMSNGMPSKSAAPTGPAAQPAAPRRNQSTSNGGHSAAQPAPWERSTSRTSRSAQGIVEGNPAASSAARKTNTPPLGFVGQLMRSKHEELMQSMAPLWDKHVLLEKKMRRSGGGAAPMQTGQPSSSSLGQSPMAMLQPQQLPVQPPVMMSYQMNDAAQQHPYARQFQHAGHF